MRRRFSAVLVVVLILALVHACARACACAVADIPVFVIAVALYEIFSIRLSTRKRAETTKS
jgi:hypothetical protein